MSELAPIIIVTGTGAAIGKTVTTAAIVVGLRAQGLRLVVVKTTQTGLISGEPGDLHDVCRLAGEVEPHEFVRLPDPLAPDAAGRLAGVVLPTVAEHAARLAEIAGRDNVDLVLVEGAGGPGVRRGAGGAPTRRDTPAPAAEEAGSRNVRPFLLGGGRRVAGADERCRRPVPHEQSAG